MLEEVYATIILIMGISMIGYWTIIYTIKNKSLKEGLKTSEKDIGYIAFHMLAELITGIIAIIASLLVLTKNPTGKSLMLFVLGLFLYAGINTLSWSLKNDKEKSPFLVLTAIIAFTGLLVFI